MRNNKKGFTLIELIITMMVLSVVLGILVGIVNFATIFYRDESSQVSRQESLRLIAVSFEKDIRKLVEHQTYFQSTELSGIKTYVLGDPGSVNKVTYVFNSNSSEGKVYRIVNGVTSTVAFDIQNVEVTLDTSSNPYILIDIKGKPDGRGTTNEVNVKVFLRLLNEGG